MMQWLLLAAVCAGAVCPDTVPRAGDDARAPAAVAQEGPAPLEVEVAHTRETLTRGRGEWTESSVRITHRERGAGSRLIFLQGRYLTRFGREDGEIALGTIFPLAPQWTVSLDAGFSPAPVFLPEWNAGGSLSHVLGGGWVAGYGLRYLEYTTAPALVQQGMVDYYTGPYMVGYVLTHTDVRDTGNGVAHTGRAARFYGAGSNVSVGATAGRGVETFGPDDVRLLDLHSVALWGIHWLDHGTGISWALGWHRHGELFERSGLTLGVRQRL